MPIDRGQAFPTRLSQYHAINHARPNHYFRELFLQREIQ